MALFQNTAEGQANGTTLTIANSGGGSGDAFQNVNGTVLFVDSPAARAGSSSCYRESSSAAYPFWGVNQFPLQNNKTIAARAYFWCASLPTSSSLILCLDRSNSLSAGCRVGVLSGSGRFIVQGTSGTLATSPTNVVFPLNTWIRVEAIASGGGNASSGTIKVAIYLGESTTPLWTYEVASGANTGTGGLNVPRAGRFSGTWGSPLHFDDFAAADAVSTYIGPAVVVPPNYGTATGSTSWSGTAVGSKPLPMTSLLYDGFDRNGITAGTADTGQTWDTNVGDWDTDGSTLGSTSMGDGNWVSVDVGTKVQDFQARLVDGIGANKYPSILINWEGGGTYYRAEVNPAGIISLNRGINTAFTALGQSASGAMSNGKTLRLKSEIGSTSTLLTVFVDDVQVLQATDAWQSAGRPAPVGTRVGFRHGAATGGLSIRWDDAYVNRVAIVPALGTATGTTSWTGTAAGKEQPSASASGTTTRTGTAAGKEQPSASASGTTTRTGSAVGLRQRSAAGTGATTWTGTAVGTVARSASGSGTTTRTGTAVGTVARSASASGNTTRTGTAVGTVVRRAAAAGTTTRTGTAVGKEQPVATATGTTSWTGSAVGSRPRRAAAAGSTVWSGSATATGSRSATGTGTTSYSGSASSAVGRRAVAAGATTRSGTAVGRKLPRAAAAGTTTRTGTAVGRKLPRAAGAGTTTWTGIAVGGAEALSTATGETAWSGTAVGRRLPVATAAGTTTRTGTAVGRRLPVTTAAGATSWVGTAEGAVAETAWALGTTTWTGAAVGTVVRSATASGTTTWTGTVAGRRLPRGLAAGTTSWSGSAVGDRPGLSIPDAAAAGRTTWDGSAVGIRQPKATADGTTSWSSLATGSVVRTATADGTTSWTGLALGGAVETGAATGLTAWTGTAVGLTPDVGRDITIVWGKLVTTQLRASLDTTQLRASLDTTRLVPSLTERVLDPALTTTTINATLEA